MEIKQLDKVGLVARSEEARAATELQQRQQLVQQSQTRLGQLEQFRSEYEARLQGMSNAGIDARQLSDYRRFLANLNDAINQQGNEVAQGEAKLVEGRDELKDRSLRRGSLDELVSRTRASLARESVRIEQLQSDERSMQRYESE
ncbi:MAG: flagellar export protein FliJ [Congregibacter sp.]